MIARTPSPTRAYRRAVSADGILTKLPAGPAAPRPRGSRRADPAGAGADAFARDPLSRYRDLRGKCQRARVINGKGRSRVVSSLCAPRSLRGLTLRIYADYFDSKLCVSFLSPVCMQNGMWKICALNVKRRLFVSVVMMIVRERLSDDLSCVFVRHFIESIYGNRKLYVFFQMNCYHFIPFVGDAE